MKVFVTGATGFIGTAIVQELINAGHQVLGLARSEASAQKLTAAGAEVHRGDLEDIESLRSGAAAADGVIHVGFVHDFSRLQEICRIDKTAIETIGDVLAGSNRPFIVASGTALVSPGQIATEDILPPVSPGWPRASEQTADEVDAKGVKASAIRLSPSVHGLDDKHGFIPILVNIAREKGGFGLYRRGYKSLERCASHGCRASFPPGFGKRGSCSPLSCLGRRSHHR
ncbi:NAD-dependent epimerase/dehydratase family protein [Mucilaginibacter sp. CAU 1740]|uniref:NAD-dependent epimerase/dehydratase family protein n=1 Tax=Mucilaginibacter sp. CAU 1740 TaxID=3140365 RepID=UPI00325A9DFF